MRSLFVQCLSCTTSSSSRGWGSRDHPCPAEFSNKYIIKIDTLLKYCTLSILLVKHVHFEIRMGWCPKTGEGQRWAYDVFWCKTKGVFKDFRIQFGLGLDKSKKVGGGVNVQTFLASFVKLVSRGIQFLELFWVFI